jgi:hypothetical protein
LEDGAENATLSWVFPGVIPVILGTEGTTAVILAVKEGCEIE